MGKMKRPKAEMIKEIAEESGVFEHQVKAVLKSLIRSILVRLANGETVHIMSLGKFWLNKQKSNYVWNPITKVKVQKPERYVPKFTYGQRAYYFVREEAGRLLRGK